MIMQDEIKQSPGQIVGYYDKSHFSLGMVVSVSGTEIMVCRADGQVNTIPAGRIMISGKEIYSGNNSSERVGDFFNKVQLIIPHVDLQAIWEKYCASAELLSLEELAGDKAENDVYTFALFLALAQDRQYFQPKGRLYLPRTPEQKEQFLTDEKQHQQEEDYHQKVLGYIEAVSQKLPEETSVSLVDRVLTDKRSQFEADLYRHLVVKPEAWLRKALKQIVQKNTPSPENDIEHLVEGLILLIRSDLQKIDSNTPHNLALSGLPVLFPAVICAQAKLIPDFVLSSEYIDLTNLDCITIDADETQDRDDALSAVKTDSGWQVGIHISEVDCFVAISSNIDNEAYLRTSSIYLTDYDVPMLPEIVSYQVASLQTGKVRPVISLLIDITNDLEITKATFIKAAIRVKQALSYQVCDEIISEDNIPENRSWTDETIHLLNNLAAKHKAFRDARGAVNSDAEAVTPARKLVAEMMVICNSYAAQRALMNGVPFYYRCLEDKIKVETDYEGRERIIIPASVLTHEPIKHQAMGLEIYAQVTSPIRRYADLVNQRQLSAWVEKKAAPYTKSDLQSMLLHLNQIRRKIKQL